MGGEEREEGGVSEEPGMANALERDIDICFGMGAGHGEPPIKQLTGPGNPVRFLVIHVYPASNLRPGHVGYNRHIPTNGA